MNFVSTCFIHAIIPSIIVLFLSILLNLAPSAEYQWSIQKEFTFFCVYLLFIGLGQFLIRDLIYNNPENWSLKYVIEETRNTFSIGVVFVAICVPVNYSRLQKQNSQKASLINTTFTPTPEATTHQGIFIHTQVKSENFNLNVSNFLFSRSERNYLEIFVMENNSVKKELKRISLVDFKKQLGAFNNIIKTHRSFLVNLNHVISISGNAQGYSLKLNHCNEEVPVSRNQIKILEQRMKKI